MPIYSYRCACGTFAEFMRPIAERDALPECALCRKEMPRELSAPRFRFAGVAAKGGGPDKFTADVLGIPLKELPAGLRTEPEKG